MPFIAKNIMHLPSRIYPARQSIIGATDQWHSIFDSAKCCIRRMLPLGCAFPEPAIVGQIQQKIGLLTDIFTHELWKNVFEANQDREGNAQRIKDERRRL